jgi:tetratricopeptide (TPR) repeat protein
MISWVAMDRIVERKRAADARYREHTAGRPLRSAARSLPEAGLLAKLATFGIALDRSTLAGLAAQALSAEEIAKPLLDHRDGTSQRDKRDRDWIWICLDALWQRWLPDVPSLERLDDRMQAGYDQLAAGETAAACRTWLTAWADARCLLDKAGLASIAAFDARFCGSQSLFNWLQDLETELWNAGLQDRAFLTARIALCEEGLRHFPAEDTLLTENWRRALAESYAELGDTEKMEGLYRAWLTADPGWGWGWIGWADCYRFARRDRQDLARAEQLLLEGLAIPAVRDRPDLVDRLADLYDEQGRAAEARAVRRAAHRPAPTVATVDVRAEGRVLRQKTTLTFGGEGLPLNQLSAVIADRQDPALPVSAKRQKVGRNEPCPCGSGKKFKRCCGRGATT